MVGCEGRVTGTERRAGSEGVVIVALHDGAGSVHDGPDAAKMVSDCVVRRHSRSVLQKSCCTVDTCLGTLQGIGRVSSADGHGIGQVAGVDHAVAACVFNLVLRPVGEPVVGGRLGVSAGHCLGETLKMQSASRSTQ